MHELWIVVSWIVGSCIMNEHNPLIRQKDTFCKADKIIFESEIDLNETAVNTRRKTRQTEEIYKNWETLGGTARFDRPASDTSVIICSRWIPEQLKLSGA